MPHPNHLLPRASYLILLLAIMTGILLASCTTPGAKPAPEPVDTPFVSPLAATSPFASPLQEPIVSRDNSLAKEKATVKGQLFSSKTNAPLANVVVRFAEVYYPDNAQAEQKTGGVYALDNAFSPSAISDSQGFFTFTEIDARDYVLLVGDIFGVWALALDDTLEKPNVWTAEERSSTDIGKIYVDF